MSGAGGLSRLERVAWFIARHDAVIAALTVIALGAAAAFVLLR